MNMYAHNSLQQLHPSEPLGLVARDELAKATQIQGNDANISTN